LGDERISANLYPAPSCRRASGIGLALAWLLSRKGATVILAARSADKLKQLEHEIPGSLAIATDMLKLEDIRNLIQQAKEKFGRIDILVNNAGQGLCAPVESIDLCDYQAVIPIMRQQGGGMILNVSSVVPASAK
jgi:NADP-dependent 3-hydroxy acid dehydrogenase YdfG